MNGRLEWTGSHHHRIIDFIIYSFYVVLNNGRLCPLSFRFYIVLRYQNIRDFQIYLTG